MIRLVIVSVLVFIGAWQSARSQEIRFERVVIDADFPGAYQVEVADINGDKKPDIVAVGGGTCAWYENPSWRKQIVTGPDKTPGIISSASTDFIGAGHAAIAVAYHFEMNEPTHGDLLRVGPDENSISPRSITNLGPIPSIHRLRWGNFDGDSIPDLVVAPVFGPSALPPKFQQSAAAVLVQLNGSKPLDSELKREFAGSDLVLHAIRVLDVDGDGRDEILTAGNSGIMLLDRDLEGRWSSKLLVRGLDGPAPARGCSEVHLGKAGDGRSLLATVEPWHGNMVVVYVETEAGTLKFGARTVIDDSLDAGHALWVADIDADGIDEVFAGHRGKDHRVSMYRYKSGAWTRTVIDRAIAAQDLRGGDLDSDGKPDVVAVGGSTGNVVWYRPVTVPAASR
jgi:hypothetical protein